MAETITANSRVPFGRKRFPGDVPMKGRKLCELNDAQLKWITSLVDTDLHVWAVAARGVLDFRAKMGLVFAGEDAMEAEADRLLREAGFGHLAKPLKSMDGGARKGRARPVRRW